MAIPWQQAGVFAAGALVGALAGGWAAYESADALRNIAHPKPDAQALRQDAPCPGAVTLSASSADDAKFQLMDADARHRAEDVNAFILIGQQAAASRRLRDAEIAYVMACRVAARPGVDAVHLADAKFQLARHFANVARERSGPQREDLVRRARALYGDSMRLYAARLGTDHEKTNIAAGALAALDEPVVATAAPAPAPAPALAVAPSRSPAHSSDTRVAGAAAAPRVSTVRPSFDCSKARSRSERLICADPQLAQLDHELGRLHAQAKAGAPDAKDFKRRSDAEWKRREQACRDRACLLAWFAQRRAQLLEEIDAQHTRRTAAVTRR